MKVTRLRQIPESSSRWARFLLCACADLKRSKDNAGHVQYRHGNAADCAHECLGNWQSVTFTSPQ